MRFRTPTAGGDVRDETIRRLESDLYMARLDIVRLAPEQFQSLLESFHACGSRSEAYRWRDDVADKVVEAAVPISEGTRAELFGERASCPLCRGEAQSYYNERGFSLPEGLRRHLVGFGRVRECPVMRAAMALALDSWDRRFSAGEAAEAVAAKQVLEKRRATEALYVLGPADAGVLVDEGLPGWRNLRRPADGEHSVAWAEQRLVELGFQIQTDGRCRSYTKRTEEAGKQFVIYADPRRLGQISFRVFDASITRGKRLRVPVHTFEIRDAWKNHLPEKVAVGLEAASQPARR